MADKRTDDIKKIEENLRADIFYGKTPEEKTALEQQLRAAEAEHKKTHPESKGLIEDAAVQFYDNPTTRGLFLRQQATEQSSRDAAIAFVKQQAQALADSLHVPMPSDEEINRRIQAAEAAKRDHQRQRQSAPTAKPKTPDHAATVEVSPSAKPAQSTASHSPEEAQRLLDIGKIITMTKDIPLSAPTDPNATVEKAWLNRAEQIYSSPDARKMYLEAYDKKYPQASNTQGTSHTSEGGLSADEKEKRIHAVVEKMFAGNANNQQIDRQVDAILHSEEGTKRALQAYERDHLAEHAGASVARTAQSPRPNQEAIIHPDLPRAAPSTSITGDGIEIRDAGGNERGKSPKPDHPVQFPPGMGMGGITADNADEVKRRLLGLMGAMVEEGTREAAMPKASGTQSIHQLPPASGSTTISTGEVEANCRKAQQNLVNFINAHEASPDGQLLIRVEEFKQNKDLNTAAERCDNLGITFEKLDAKFGALPIHPKPSGQSR